MDSDNNNNNNNDGTPMNVDDGNITGTTDDTNNNNNTKKNDDEEEETTSQLVLVSSNRMTMTNTVKKQQIINDVIVHPLVLLSVADHYHRVARGTRKRVIGILLGQTIPNHNNNNNSNNGSNSNGMTTDVTNSFALPFEEDSKNPAIFYLDHNYLESMYHMFRKVNAKERIVGFYSTGPQIRSNDLRIYDIVTRYTSSTSTTISSSSSSSTTPSASLLPTYPAIFSIIDIRPDRSDLPVTSYTVTEQVNTINTTSGGTGGSSRTSTNKKPQQQAIERIFVHVPTTLGAVEAEEVGVEHLLRDIHDPTISTIASLIQEKVVGLQTLHTKLLECQQYIQSCIPPPSSTTDETSAGTGTAGTTKATSAVVSTINPTIVSNLQTIISLLPNTIAIADQYHHTSMMQQTNDMYMSIYIAAVLRTVMALHDLINNQMKYGTDGNYNHPSIVEDDSGGGAAAALTNGTTAATTTTKNEEKKE